MVHSAGSAESFDISKSSKTAKPKKLRSRVVATTAKAKKLRGQQQPQVQKPGSPGAQNRQTRS